MTSTHRNLPSKAGLSLLEAVGALSPQQQLMKGAVKPQGNDLFCPSSPHLPETGSAFPFCSHDSEVSQLHLCLYRKICFVAAAVSTWTPSPSEWQHGWHNSARTHWNKWVFIKFCKEIIHPQCFIRESVSKQGEDLGRSTQRGGSLDSAALFSSPASGPAKAALRF